MVEKLSTNIDFTVGKITGIAAANRFAKQIGIAVDQEIQKVSRKRAVSGARMIAAPANVRQQSSVMRISGSQQRMAIFDAYGRNQMALNMASQRMTRKELSIRSKNAAMMERSTRGGMGRRGLLSGFGMYMAGGMAGGPMGALGAGLMMSGGGIGAGVGGAMLGAGVAYKGATSAYRGANRVAGMLGVDAQGIQAFAEFERAMFVTSKNLEETFNPEMMRKLKGAISDVATTMGGAGGMMDFAMMAKRIAGSGLIPSDVSANQKISMMKGILKESAGLAMVSEGAGAEETSLMLAKLASAQVGAGVPVDMRRNAAFIDRAASMGLIEVEGFNKQAAAIALSLSRGQDLGSVLTQMTLLGRVGFTPGMAGTAVKRMGEKMGNLKVAGQIGGILGVSRGEIQEMSVGQVIGGLSRKYKQGGFDERLLTGFIEEMFKNVRAGRGATLIAKNIEGFEALENVFKDGANVVENYNRRLAEASKLQANQIGSAKNLIAGLKLTGAGYAAPFVGGMAQSLMYNNPQNWSGGKLYNPKTGEQIMMPSQIAEEQRAKAIKEGNEAFIGIIDGFERLSEFLMQFTGEAGIKNAVAGLSNAFEMLTKISVGLADFFVGLIATFGEKLGMAEEDVERFKMIRNLRNYRTTTGAQLTTGQLMGMSPEEFSALSKAYAYKPSVRDVWAGAAAPGVSPLEGIINEISNKSALQAMGGGNLPARASVWNALGSMQYKYGAGPGDIDMNKLASDLTKEAIDISNAENLEIVKEGIKDALSEHGFTPENMAENSRMLVDALYSFIDEQIKLRNESSVEGSYQ